MNDPYAWWSKTNALDHLALYEASDSQLQFKDGSRVWVRVAQVSGEFFQIFDQPMLDGRSLMRDDELKSARVAVVSSALWPALSQGRSISDGVELVLGGLDYLVVGVSTRTLTFPSAATVWIPRLADETLRPLTVDGAGNLPPARNRFGWIAELRAHVTVEQLETEMLGLLESANTVLSKETGTRYGDLISVINLPEAMVAPVKTPMLVLLISTIGILTLAVTCCAVFMALRWLTRANEFGLRRCLGASSGAIALELASDAAVFCLSSLAVAMPASFALSQLGRNLLVSYRVYSPPVATFWLLTTLLCLVACGLAAAAGWFPMWMKSRTVTLSFAAREFKSQPGGLPLFARQVFVFFATVVAAILLLGSAVTNRTLVLLLQQNLGFDPKNVVMARLAVRRGAIGDFGYQAKRNELISAAQSFGLRSVSFSSGIPIVQADRRYIQVKLDDIQTMASSMEVDGDYFDALRIPREVSGSRRGIVINETLDRRLSQGSSSVGRVLTVAGRSTAPIVAIVPDGKTSDQASRIEAEVYLPFDEIRGSVMPDGAVSLQLVAKCDGSCAGALEKFAELPRLVSGVIVIRVDELTHLIAATRTNSVVAASVWSIYGALAVTVAIFGVFILVGHSAASRRTEIGIRLALGAPRRSLIFQLAANGALMTGLGTIVGVTSAWFGAHAAASLTTTIAHPEPLDLAIVLVGLTLLGGCISAVPAIAATRVDPVRVLREG